MRVFCGPMRPEISSDECRMRFSNEKTRSTSAKRVLSIAGGKQVSLYYLKSLNFTLKVLAGDKLDRLGFRNADLLKRFRVNAFSRLSFDDLESAKTDELNHLVLLY